MPPLHHSTEDSHKWPRFWPLFRAQSTISTTIDRKIRKWKPNLSSSLENIYSQISSQSSRPSEGKKHWGCRTHHFAISHLRGQHSRLWIGSGVRKEEGGLYESGGVDLIEEGWVWVDSGGYWPSGSKKRVLAVFGQHPLICSGGCHIGTNLLDLQWKYFREEWKFVAIPNEITFNTQEFLIVPKSATDRWRLVMDRRWW